MGTVIELLKEKLVGKNCRICTHDKYVVQPYMVHKKKSNNVTDTQFNSGNPKFRMEVNGNKTIGRHKIFEDVLITDIEWLYDCEYHGETYELVLILENGSRVPLTPHTEIKE